MRFVCFGFVVLMLLVPAVAADGYIIHCNVDGATVLLNNEIVGTVQDHELSVPWKYGNDFPFMILKADGYLEEWDKLEQPWPGIENHLYYRLLPAAYGTAEDGDIRVLISPTALSSVYIRDLSPNAENDNWEYYGDYYGNVFIIHYVPVGKKEIKIKRRNFEDVSANIKVIGAQEVDVTFQTVRTAEIESINSAQMIELVESEKTAKRVESFLVVEENVEGEDLQETLELVNNVEPSVATATIPPPIEGVDVLPDDEKGINVLGFMILMGIICAFVGGGYVVYTKFDCL